MVYFFDIDGGSILGYEDIDLVIFGQVIFYCDDVEVLQFVCLVVIDVLGYMDSCDVDVIVAIGDILLFGWMGFNVGFIFGGSIFVYNFCIFDNLECGEFIIIIIVFNQFDLIEDNYVYIIWMLCGCIGL